MKEPVKEDPVVKASPIVMITDEQPKVKTQTLIDSPDFKIEFKMTEDEPVVAAKNETKPVVEVKKVEIKNKTKPVEKKAVKNVTKPVSLVAKKSLTKSPVKKLPKINSKVVPLKKVQL